MENSLLYQKISLLPEHLKKEVEDIIDKLLQKNKPQKKVNKAKAGSGKGTFVMKPGFDDPLEDFKEYME